MKILVITADVGKTAPGIVFEKLIYGLSKIHDIEILTEKYEPNIDLTKISTIHIVPKKKIHPRITKLFISTFKFDPFDLYWAKKAIKNLKKSKKKHDIVIGLISYSHYSSLIASQLYAKRAKIKYAIHTADAIPPPIGWLQNGPFYRGLKLLMKKYLKDVDGFFSTNREMLNYQLQTFKQKPNLITNIIYNPGFDIPLNLSIKESSNYIYTGGIYGVRKADQVIKAFLKLQEIYPETELHFIGTQLNQEALLSIKNNTKIKIFPFTKNLVPFYEKAIALIDIDADIENDVFISSKMPNYLQINRFIISQTGRNSPSRNLFKDIDSIIQCDHNSEQILNAMKKCQELKHSIQFNDRNGVIELFKLENIIAELDKSIQLIVQKPKEI